LRCYDDHRLAMAFGALALRVPGTEIDDPHCVAKTFPEFWDVCAEAGVDLEELDERSAVGR
ncbi:MAG TPA: hypothetical protein VLA19_18720, partial [Herpetosiphonaceae bacterium]|nr:hypothetical protein [Herpetosiphonaceae bacterium]